MGSSSVARKFMPANPLGCTIDHADSTTKPPSAIAAFSDLISISSPHRLTHDSPPALSVARRVSSESWSTGPHSLPTEIVQMIFQFVFESCVGSEDRADGDSPVLWLDEDPLSPSLFPYSLACVCLRWFQILRTIPVYWTRLVITVDAIVISLDAAYTTLEWAGERPLKVIVTRHRGTSETDDSERKSVGRAMELLRPHISHIWSLSFDLEYTSAIPALWRESGCARHLKMLALKSHSDAGRTSRSPTGNSHEYEGKLEVPLLEQITFSDHFLKNPLMTHPRLASWFRHVTSLAICGDAASGGSAISPYRFLSAIDLFPSIRELTVEDIHFDDNAPYEYINLLLLRPAVLCLRRVTGKTVLRDILTRVPGVESSSRADITIVDCTVHPDAYFYFSSTNLTLAFMDSSATIEALVCQWNGERLTVISCPKKKMRRSFLERLHGEAAPTSLSHLQIVDCDHFSARDVILLVHSREVQAHASRMDESRTAKLVELRVHGRGPSITAGRARWLSQYVDTFSWDTVAKDGVRYVWDGSAKRLIKSPASGALERSLQGQAGNNRRGSQKSRSRSGIGAQIGN